MPELLKANVVPEAETEHREILNLYAGDEAYELIFEPFFKQEWERLYESCSWATAFQSWEFASSWYQAFKEEYVPIIIAASNNNSLSGLLTMAMPSSQFHSKDIYKRPVKIFGAGDFESEYQVWIADGKNQHIFIQKALLKILEFFPLAHIQFRFIPASTPLEWVEKPNWKKMALIQKFRRPLLNFENPQSQAAIKISRQYKTKLNRLKKAGNLSFEKILDYAHFEKALEVLAAQFDFRQGCMFNKNQFLDKPLKKTFMLELFKKELLHVTVLKLNEEIIGSMAAISGKGWVHLQGLNTHSPFYAKHSPGILHFLHLGRMLKEEGIFCFDLTPGGDFYKEKMATDYDEVSTLIITNDRKFRTKRVLKKHFHKRLLKAGLRPMSVELKIDRAKYALKNFIKIAKTKGLPGIAKFWRQSLFRSGFKVYRLEANSHKPGFEAKISRNSLEELLQYEDTPDFPRWDFMKNAMKMFESGAQAFSWAEENKLLGCAWISEKFSDDATGIDYEFPEDAAILHSVYLHPAVTGQISQFLYAIKNELQENGQCIKVYAVIDRRNKDLIQKFEISRLL